MCGSFCLGGICALFRLLTQPAVCVDKGEEADHWISCYVAQAKELHACKRYMESQSFTVNTKDYPRITGQQSQPGTLTSESLLKEAAVLIIPCCSKGQDQLVCTGVRARAHTHTLYPHIPGCSVAEVSAACADFWDGLPSYLAATGAGLGSSTGTTICSTGTAIYIDSTSAI